MPNLKNQATISAHKAQPSQAQLESHRNKTPILRSQSPLLPTANNARSGAAAPGRNFLNQNGVSAQLLNQSTELANESQNRPNSANRNAEDNSGSQLGLNNN